MNPGIRPPLHGQDARPLRAGIIGAGYIGLVHAHALRDLGVEVAAICGRQLPAAQRFVERLGSGTAYCDLDAMLRAEALDVVHVCTPNDLHHAQTMRALQCGVHVLCEKPLAITSDQSREMCESAASAGLLGGVAFHVRGYPLIRNAAQRIAGGQLGALHVVHGRSFCDDALHSEHNWRYEAASSGPSYVTADLGAHWLDLVEYLTGLRIERLSADFGSLGGHASTPQRPLEDYSAILLRFAGGARGSVAFTALAPGRKNQLLFECEGSDGGLTWDQEAPNQLIVRPRVGDSSVVLKSENMDGVAPGVARFPAGHAEGYGDAFRNIFHDFYTAVAGSAGTTYPTFADGHRGMVLLDAVLESARRGTWCDVPGVCEKRSSKQAAADDPN